MMLLKIMKQKVETFTKTLKINAKCQNNAKHQKNAKIAQNFKNARKSSKCKKGRFRATRRT